MASFFKDVSFLIDTCVLPREISAWVCFLNASGTELMAAARRLEKHYILKSSSNVIANPLISKYVNVKFYFSEIIPTFRQKYQARPRYHAEDFLLDII